MNLEELGITKEDILEKVAGHLVDEMEEDAKSQIRSFIREKVQSKVEAQVSAIVSECAAKALDGTFQPVNCFGELIGQPTTIRDIFIKRTTEWWNQKVDRNGQPSNSYGSFGTMAEWHASQVVTKILADNLSKELQPIIATSKTQLGLAISNAIVEIVKKQLK